MALRNCYGVTVTLNLRTGILTLGKCAIITLRGTLTVSAAPLLIFLGNSLRGLGRGEVLLCLAPVEVAGVRAGRR